MPKAREEKIGPNEKTFPKHYGLGGWVCSLGPPLYLEFWLGWVGLDIGFLTRPCIAMYATPLQVPLLPFAWLYAADLIIWFCFDMRQPSQYRCGCGVLISNVGKAEREHCKSEQHQR